MNDKKINNIELYEKNPYNTKELWFKITDIKSVDWEIIKIEVKSELENRKYNFNVDNLKNEEVFWMTLFEVWYIVIDNKNFFKVFLKKWKEILPLEKNQILFLNKDDKWLLGIYRKILWKYLPDIIKRLKKAINENMQIKEVKINIDNNSIQVILIKQNLSCKEKVYILLNALFLYYRYYLSLLNEKPEYSKDFWNNKKFLDKLYWIWILTFPDILSIYFYWWFDDKTFISYLDKVLDKRYLLYQLQDERFYDIYQNLIADKELAQEFLKQCKSIKKCLDEMKTSYTRYNLYVRLVVIDKLYKRKIISEGDYERYKKNIFYVIDILREMKKLEEEKRKEEENEVKKIKDSIDEFLMTQ